MTDIRCSSGSKTVRHALHDLADNIRSKVVQLTHYRDHGCQLDHARVIAEGRIAQANQILHWIDESIAKVSGAPAQASPDQRLTEDMTLAHNARKAAIEECKRLIEESQETFSETHEGSRRHLTPRKHGNSAGLAYADGIGALSAVTPSPGPGERADRLEDERNRLQNSYGSGPFADGLITRRIAEIDKELSSLSSTHSQSLQNRDEMLRGLAEFFSESVHLVWSNDEIADCLTGMIGDGSQVTSTDLGSGK